jgi:hypothetical protein
MISKIWGSRKCRPSWNFSPTLTILKVTDLPILLLEIFTYLFNWLAEREWLCD